MMAGVIELCRNRWHGLLPHFGVPAKVLDGKQHPCPKCGGKDRFRWDNRDGRGTYFCNACKAGDGVMLAMLMTGRSMREILNRLKELVQVVEPRKPKPELSEQQIMDSILALWKASKRITPDDDAGRYLASRGLDIPQTNALRFVPKVKADGKILSAMIAKVCGPDGVSTSLHRTYLLDGAKAPIDSPRRMMSGKLPQGYRIELTPPAEEMGVAEGIETALHASRRFGVPCWSAVNATELGRFVPPAMVKRLHIFGDHDPKFGGHAASYTLAHRLACYRDDIEVIVHIPETVGTDWADAA